MAHWIDVRCLSDRKLEACRRAETAGRGRILHRVGRQKSRGNTTRLREFHVARLGPRNDVQFPFRVASVPEPLQQHHRAFSIDIQRQAHFHRAASGNFRRRDGHARALNLIGNRCRLTRHRIDDVRDFQHRIRNRHRRPDKGDGIKFGGCQPNAFGPRVGRGFAPVARRFDRQNNLHRRAAIDIGDFQQSAVVRAGGADELAAVERELQLERRARRDSAAPRRSNRKRRPSIGRGRRHRRRIPDHQARYDWRNRRPCFGNARIQCHLNRPRLRAVIAHGQCRKRRLIAEINAPGG